MVAVVTELFDGRRQVASSNPRIEVPYLVTDAVDEADVITEVKATAPAFESGLVRKSVEVDERLDASSWKVIVRYGLLEVDDEEGIPDPVFTFDTSGGIQHITQAIATIGVFGPEASMELGGAIGFDGETVQGTDVTIPRYRFTETHYFEDVDVTTAYKVQLSKLTGKVNDASFKGFDSGEVIFRGASGSKRSSGLWEITFIFEVSENLVMFPVGDFTVDSKKGWEHLSVTYGEDVDNTVKSIIKKPVAAYVNQIAELGDFSLMDIGT